MTRLIVDFKIINADRDANGDVYVAEVTTEHCEYRKRLVDKSNMSWFKKRRSSTYEFFWYENSFTTKAFKSNGKWVWETGDDASELDGHETVYWGLLRLKKKIEDNDKFIAK